MNKRLRVLRCAAAIVVVVACAAPSQVPPPQRGGEKAARFPKDAAEFDKMFKAVSNWGRWGKDDELGTANLITDAKRKQAIALAKTGVTVSLQRTLITEKAIDNPNPFVSINAGNEYRIRFHGFVHSHIDALCHNQYNKQMYNGFPAEEVESPSGCRKLGIEHMKNGFVTRGVLVDMPRLKGVPYLEPGAPVYPEDIEAWEKKVGVKLMAGDAILLRTGRWLRREKLGPWSLMDAGEPGYHASVVPWLKQRDVAFIGADDSNDVLPSLVDGVQLPVHRALIVSLGAYVFDALDLEAVAETAARLNRWEFMLSGAPLAVTGGTGGPVNLIAIF